MAAARMAGGSCQLGVGGVFLVLFCVGPWWAFSAAAWMRGGSRRLGMGGCNNSNAKKKNESEAESWCSRRPWHAGSQPLPRRPWQVVYCESTAAGGVL
jgi:hypothetical protein